MQANVRFHRRFFRLRAALRVAVEPTVTRPMDSPTPLTTPLPDRWLAGFFLLAVLGLRILYAWHFRVDSDEPQHLHVVWAWSRGLLPYRDVFDNHTPVFQALCAPLFRALGVRADILLPMRAAMIPIFAATIWCVWKIARTFFTPRIGLWTAVLAALWPPFFFDSIEFRPDELWALLWLVTLTVLVTGRLRTARLFGTGLLLGLSFCVSMKTSLFLAALAFACAALLVFRRAAGQRADWPRIGLGAGAAVAGLPVIPVLTVLFFILHGAGPQMRDCVITHNILPGSHSLGGVAKSFLHWLLWLLPMAGGGAVIARLPYSLEMRSRIAFTFFAAAFYDSTLLSFWPVLTAEDDLPFYPSMAITAAPALLWLGDFAARRLRLPAVVAPALFAAGCVAWIVRAHSPFTDETQDRIGIIADTLKLTDESDWVMDAKGEMIYRNRVSRYVMEEFTNKRLRSGLLPDDVAGRLVEKRAPLVSTRRMPLAARAFMRANYVPIAWRLRTLGQVLREEGTVTHGPLRFAIAVPQCYTVVTPAGMADGTLDGTAFTGPRELTAGTHEFLPAKDSGEVVLVWAQAIERGYSPFTKIRPDYTTEQD